MTTVNTITHEYDNASRLTGIDDASSQYAYEYDAAGRVLSVDNAGNPAGVPRTVLTNSYDLAGLRTGLTATDPTNSANNDFVNAYAYDDAGRLTRVTQTGQTGGRSVADKRVDLSYDLLGRFDVIGRYADLAGTQLVATTDHTFDLAGRLTGLDHANGATNLGSYAYGYDAEDRLTSATVPTVAGSDTTDYAYDDTDQLTGADHTAQTDENYAYDANGNRVSGGSVVDSGNRIAEDATHTYLYDDNGNLLRETLKSDGSYRVHWWDHRDRLIKVVFRTSAGVLTKTVSYRYDVFDRRVAKDVDDNGDGVDDRGERFVYDGGDLVLKTDANGNVLHRYLHGPAHDQVFADEDALNDVLWSLADNLGTVRDWVEYDTGSDTTTVANHLDYDALGNIVAQSDPTHDPPVGFTGQDWDADVGLYHYSDGTPGGRWYHPRLGRFTKPDEKGFNAGDANLYRYVGNGPTNGIDPDGMDIIEDIHPSASDANGWLDLTGAPASIFDGIPMSGHAGIDDGSITLPNNIEPTSIDPLDVNEFLTTTPKFAPTLYVPSSKTRTRVVLGLITDPKSCVAAYYEGYSLNTIYIPIRPGESDDPLLDAASELTDRLGDDAVIDELIITGHGGTTQTGAGIISLDKLNAGPTSGNWIFFATVGEYMEDDTKGIWVQACGTCSEYAPTNGYLGAVPTQPYLETMSAVANCPVRGIDDWYAIWPHGRVWLTRPGVHAFPERDTGRRFDGSVLDYLNDKLPAKPGFDVRNKAARKGDYHSNK